MKIAAINIVNMGSTGKIMLQVLGCAERAGHEVRSFSRGWKDLPAPPPNNAYFGSYLENGLHHVLAEVTGLHGAFSYFGTKQLVRMLEQWRPDVLHLHNLHGAFISLPVLFDYIKRSRVRVVWTLHDCWSFTGKCPYFTMANCDRWKTGCHDCPQLRAYPAARVDASEKMWALKKKWFTGVEDMTIVTPSQWLADLAKQSYLREYPVRVIHNGIDLSVFRPQKSDFREKYGVTGNMVLGVAFGWEKRKGLDVFLELAKKLPPSYRIVLVGTDDGVDAQLPENIVSIHRTHNQQELAEIYSAADVLVNPTREENYPTVNMEAIACGTPVVTFNTGGSAEIPDASCGIVIEPEDLSGLQAAVERVCEQHPFSEEACLRRAEAFDMQKRFAEYVQLFENGVR